MTTTSTRVEDADIASLLARAEKATGPDRELDIDLCIALAYIGYVPEPLNLRRAEDGWLDYESVEDGHAVQCADIPPELSASVDAALALVERMLPGWRLGLYQMAGHWQASLAEVDEETDLAVDDYFADGSTAPTAILAALLRSLSQGAGHEQ